MADPTSRRGQSYATPEILSWVEGIHVPHDTALRRAFEAANGSDIPAIQVSPSDGGLLAILLRLIQARRVVEVGTLAGYSAIHMVRAMPRDGHLWTIDLEPRHAAIARANLESAGVSDRVTVLEGRGMDVLPTLERKGPFDAVFLDADKGSYAEYGRWANRNLRTGGLLLADNTYLFGRLLDGSEEARSVRRFHEETAANFDSVSVATPDGLVVGIKK